jgi:hypothetical protein
MQPGTDLLDALRTDLTELTALHAPSGAEQAVIARLRDARGAARGSACRGLGPC